MRRYLGGGRGHLRVGVVMKMTGPMRAAMRERLADRYSNTMRYLARSERHAVRREGDEQACSCGKRWPVGEAHP